MISDNRLHKTRFCKKRGANRNCPHKEGVGAKKGIEKRGGETKIKQKRWQAG